MTGLHQVPPLSPDIFTGTVSTTGGMYLRDIAPETLPGRMIFHAPVYSFTSFPILIFTFITVTCSFLIRLYRNLFQQNTAAVRDGIFFHNYTSCQTGYRPCSQTIHTLPSTEWISPEICMVHPDRCIFSYLAGSCCHRNAVRLLRTRTYSTSCANRAFWYCSVSIIVSTSNSSPAVLSTAPEYLWYTVSPAQKSLPACRIPAGRTSFC